MLRYTQVQVLGQDLDSLLLCSHELLLPNHSTLHARMLLGAWEAGLEGVSEEAARLLMFALEVYRSLSGCRQLWKPGCQQYCSSIALHNIDFGDEERN